MKGLLPEDRRGDALRSQLNTILNKTDGRVVDILVIPDFVKLFKWEQQKSELEDLRKLVLADHGGFQCNTCFIPKYARHENSYQARMKKIERKIDKELENPYWNSGHAFVCFDSLESMNLVLTHYRQSPLRMLAISWQSLKSKVSSWFHPQRVRNVSTFDKFYDIDQ